MPSVDSNAVAICSVISACCTASFALVSAIWTAHINRKAILKLKSTELFFTAKSAAFTEFLQFTSSFPLAPESADFKDLQRYSTAALLYASASAQKSIALYGKLLAQGACTPAQGAALGRTRSECILVLQHDLKQYEF